MRNLAVPTLLLLPISGFVYVVGYAAIVLLMGLLSREERAAIKRTLAVWNRLPAAPGQLISARKAVEP